LTEESFHQDIQIPSLNDHPASTQDDQTLLVIGAGPKAMAIVAKKAVLARLGFQVPRVIILDPAGVAAHWSGSSGFTDGQQILGTRPEKDIGFPYISTCWGSTDLNREVDREILHFSWQSYLISEGRYSGWVDRGRPHPSHASWGRYLQWVAANAQPEIKKARVYSIARTPDETRWQISARSTETGENLTLTGNGLVLTGPGTPLTIPGQPETHPRVLDGASFWMHVAALKRQRSSLARPLNIGIVGTGETAAAIVVTLLDILRDMVFIEVINPSGVLYSRDEGFEENRLFSDPDGKAAALHSHHQHASDWLRLSEEDRREFMRRTDRGVFSLQAMAKVNLAENVRSVIGVARALQATTESVLVEIDYANQTTQDLFDYVIIARGFDALWFTAFCDEKTARYLDIITDSLDRKVIERAINEDLSLQGCVPRLHLPMLASIAQGPGFPNLSCLGLLADRILLPYVHLVR
jgi:mycobactin lysine-N-oxygenase